mmetsp:Transcript_10890/g.35883  ORF Transcript_10890/g.35883 Transcript_10890/m.35883 type:complete len:277 (+) Transcript_10890:129-959(+)
MRCREAISRPRCSASLRRGARWRARRRCPPQRCVRLACLATTAAAAAVVATATAGRVPSAWAASSTLGRLCGWADQRLRCAYWTARSEAPRRTHASTSSGATRWCHSASTAAPSRMRTRRRTSRRRRPRGSCTRATRRSRCATTTARWRPSSSAASPTRPTRSCARRGSAQRRCAAPGGGRARWPSEESARASRPSRQRASRASPRSPGWRGRRTARRRSKTWRGCTSSGAATPRRGRCSTPQSARRPPTCTCGTRAPRPTWHSRSRGGRSRTRRR